MIKKISQILLSAVAAASMGLSASAATFSPDYYASNSALAEGRWAKVKVTNNGMHQITDAELRAMGFSNPEKVAVFGTSAVALSTYNLDDSYPDDIAPIPAIRSNGKLIFYAEADVHYNVRKVSTPTDRYLLGVTRNYYADYATYFLTETEEGPQAPETVKLPTSASNPSQALGSARGFVHYEQEVQNSGTVGARFLGVPFSEERNQTYEFGMPGYNANGSIYMQTLVGVNGSKTGNFPLTTPTGTTTYLYMPLLTKNQYSYKGVSSEITLNSSALQPNAENTYRASIRTSGTVVEDGALDYFTLTYPRTTNYQGGASDILVFTSLAANRSIMMRGLPVGAMVWDVTNPYSPRNFTLARYAYDEDEEVYNASEAGNCAVFGFGMAKTINATGNCGYALAFNPADELFSVEPMGQVANQNLHATDAPTMLIVSASRFLNEANRLAEIHRINDGIDVEVVNVDDVYNEFSYGTPHIMAIRRLAHMYHQRNPEKFRSILLFGTAWYDNRGLTREDYDDFRATTIPMFTREDFEFSGSLPKAYITDAMVAMLETNSKFDVLTSKMTVNVGRIPADNIDEARIMVDKIESYITNPPATDFYNRAVAMCDLGDRNTHMADADGLVSVIEEYAPATTIYKIYNTVYPLTNRRAKMANKRLQEALSKGVAYMAFSGHAIPNSIGNGDMWTSVMASEYKHEVLPLLVLATCRAIYFDHPGGSLGEAMLFNDGGGCIALVGANREVYKEQNQYMNLALGRNFFGAEKGATFGDMFRLSRNEMVPVVPEGNTDLSLYDCIVNTLSYNLCGDPELRILTPDYSATLTTVAGNEFVNTDDTYLPSQTPVHVTGAVTNENGDVVTDFNGSGIITLFDGNKTVKTVNYDNADLCVDVPMDEDLIYEKHVTVTNGTFSTDLILPIPYYTTQANRMSLYATSEDGRRAVGSHLNLWVQEATEGESLNVAPPVISAFYIDDEEFVNGDTFGPDITVYARFEANEHGVVGMSSQFGRSLMLTLDDSKSYSEAAGAFVPDIDGGGYMRFPISNLTDGRHSLTLRVVNAAGQDAHATINFNVVNGQATPVLAAAEFPARTELNLSLTHNFGEEPAGRLVVRDLAGNVVFTDPNATFPYTWDLKDNNGDDVANGYYEVNAYLKGSRFYGGTPAVRTVIRR